MSKIKKIAKVGFILSILTLATGVIARAATLAHYLEVKIKPRLPKFDWMNLTLILDVVLTNPTAGAISFSFPKIKLFIHDQNKHGQLVKKQLAESTPGTGRIDLNPYSSATIRNLHIRVPFASIGAAIIAVMRLMNGEVGELPVFVEVITTVYPEQLPTGIPTTLEKEISIKKPTPNAS